MSVAAETECLADRLRVGDVVGGKYQIDAIVGRGGMGLVFSAVHQQLEERVALKFLTSSSDRVPSARSRFMREARVAAKLRSEHAARVSDFGTLDDGTPYMVMEFLDGTDLRQLLRDQGRLPVDIAVHYIAQACEGLSEAHARGVVHRDLKPSNLFLTKRPDGTDLVKIVDFGISKLQTVDYDDEDLTAAGVILGSPRYIAPEQLCDSGQVDGRADVWSLGAILYEMLSGHSPFEADSAAAVCYIVLSDRPPEPLAGRIDGVSPALEAAVMRCLCRDPDRRTPDVAVLAADLHAATSIEGLDVLAESIRGILERATAEGTCATGTFGLSTGSSPPTGRIRKLGAADSGAIRSDFSALGGARSYAPLTRRSRGVYVLLSVLVVTIIGSVVWTQMPSGSPAQTSASSAAQSAPPHPSAAPSTAVSAPERDAAAGAIDRRDAAGEPVHAATVAPPPTRGGGGSRRRPREGSDASTKPTEGDPPPPVDMAAPKKPRDPFGDRY